MANKNPNIKEPHNYRYPEAGARDLLRKPLKTLQLSELDSEEKKALLEEATSLLEDAAHLFEEYGYSIHRETENGLLCIYVRNSSWESCLGLRIDSRKVFHGWLTTGWGRDSGINFLPDLDWDRFEGRLYGPVLSFTSKGVPAPLYNLSSPGMPRIRCSALEVFVAEILRHLKDTTKET